MADLMQEDHDSDNNNNNASLKANGTSLILSSCLELESVLYSQTREMIAMATIKAPFFDKVSPYKLPNFIGS